MKVVFEMADADYENKDFLLQALDFEKAFIFNDIIENCVPLSKVLDDIKAEIEQFAKNPDFGDLSTGASCGAMKALEIIDKYKEEGSEK